MTVFVESGGSAVVSGATTTAYIKKGALLSSNGAGFKVYYESGADVTAVGAGGVKNLCSKIVFNQEGGEEPEPEEKSCSFSGGDWTDTRASETPCDTYCTGRGHSGGELVNTGSSKSCTGAYCEYISDFSTCEKSTIRNDSRCGCTDEITCKCS